MPHLALPPFPTRRSSDLRLAGLGPEPLSGHYTPQYLYTMARGRRAPVKAFLMDARVVVGAGNIYATEALFMAGIHRSEEHTSELQSRGHLVCRLLLGKNN